jgi:hypothetical protein
MLWGIRPTAEEFRPDIGMVDAVHEPFDKVAIYPLVLLEILLYWPTTVHEPTAGHEIPCMYTEELLFGAGFKPDSGRFAIVHEPFESVPT